MEVDTSGGRGQRTQLVCTARLLRVLIKKDVSSVLKDDDESVLGESDHWLETEVVTYEERGD
jgi:hypothetical protein